MNKNFITVLLFIFALGTRIWAAPVEFTPDEKTYLDGKQVLTMCIDPDWMPFEKNRQGQHIGMTADYFALLQSLIGVPIQMVPTKTWGESLEAGKARRCDIFSLVMSTKERRTYLDFTTPYLITPLVIATDIQSPQVNTIEEVLERKVGIVAGYAYGEILKERYPEMQLVPVKNLSEGLGKGCEGRAVRSGRDAGGGGIPYTGKFYRTD